MGQCLSELAQLRMAEPGTQQGRPTDATLASPGRGRLYPEEEAGHQREVRRDQEMGSGDRWGCLGRVMRRCGEWDPGYT